MCVNVLSARVRADVSAGMRVVLFFFLPSSPFSLISMRQLTCQPTIGRQRDPNTPKRKNAEYDIYKLSDARPSMISVTACDAMRLSTYTYAPHVAAQRKYDTHKRPTDQI